MTTPSPRRTWPKKPRAARQSTVGRCSRRTLRWTGRVPKEMIRRSRDYDDEQWDHYRELLGRRGILDGDGALTDAGRDLKQRIEDTTDRLALSALDSLNDEQLERLFLALTPITRKVIAAGDVPAATPMGLGRDDLHDDSAHLS